MTSEIDTLADAGTDTGPSDQMNDNAIPDYVYYDPDEDTEENVTQEATENDGQPETDDDPETVEASTEDETEEGEPEDDSSEPAAEYFELPDGTKVERDEAIKGYLRQSDYSRKTNEVAEYRKSLEAENDRIAGITEAFIDHLSQLVPAAPEPSLALQDPNAYTRAKAQHEAAVAQVQKLIEIGEQAKEAKAGISQADHQKTVSEQNQLLAQKFPETSNPKGRQAFFEGAASAAQEAGFTMDDLSQVTDHRMFVLAHWANEGMKAAQARSKAKVKAAKAPPASPNKPGQPKRTNRNAEAMRKLAKSGSIHDALAIDFD